MIIYFDLLQLDGKSLLGTKHSERFKTLSKLIVRNPGRADVVDRTIIDFNRGSAASDLRSGLCTVSPVPAERDWSSRPKTRPISTLASRASCRASAATAAPSSSRKSTSAQFGDVGDFAVVGARYEAAKAKAYGIPRPPVDALLCRMPGEQGRCAPVGPEAAASSSPTWLN